MIAKKDIKIAVYFQYFEPLHQFKDPGLICSGLKEEGFDVSMITSEKDELKGCNFPYDVIQIKSPLDTNTLKKFDVFIIYWWGMRYTAIEGFIKCLKDLGKLVILKTDSDGRFGGFKNPKPRFHNFMVKPVWKNLPKNLIKNSLFYRHIFECSRVKQFELADYISIESPDAAQNLSFFLSEYKREDIIKKIRVIPDAVSDYISNSAINDKEKENIVVSVARWEDVFPKNPKTVALSLCQTGSGDSPLKRGACGGFAPTPDP